MEDIMDFLEGLGEETTDAVMSAVGYILKHKKWIMTQIAALPYIFAAFLFIGAFWFITSMLAIMCG